MFHPNRVMAVLTAQEIPGRQLRPSILCNEGIVGGSNPLQLSTHISLDHLDTTSPHLQHLKVLYLLNRWNLSPLFLLATLHFPSHKPSVEVLKMQGKRKRG